MKLFRKYFFQVESKLSKNVLLSMTRVPDSSTVRVLDLYWVIEAPFLNQLMIGFGLPEAWQGKIAIVLIGRVY